MSDRIWPLAVRHWRPLTTHRGNATLMSREVLGGYWLVEAPSKEEVVKWAQRCPAEPGDTIEIRQIFEAADFAIKK